MPHGAEESIHDNAKGSGEFHFGYVHGHRDCKVTTRDGEPAVPGPSHNTAFNLFGENSVALKWLETSGLPEFELAELGFKKIAEEALIFRHSALRTPFSDRHHQDQDADVEALPEYEEWVMKKWEPFKNVAED